MPGGNTSPTPTFLRLPTSPLAEWVHDPLPLLMLFLCSWWELLLAVQHCPGYSPYRAPGPWLLACGGAACDSAVMMRAVAVDGLHLHVEPPVLSCNSML
jgi:hypothetical protein